MVSNQVFLKPRSTIREVSKVYGFSNEQINSITKRVRSFTFSRNLKDQVQKDSRFSEVDIDERLQNVLKCSEKILGVFRHSSVHPGGAAVQGGGPDAGGGAEPGHAEDNR